VTVFSVSGSSPSEMIASISSSGRNAMIPFPLAPAYTGTGACIGAW
jgi:hypothetical protein